MCLVTLAASQASVYWVGAKGGGGRVWKVLDLFSLSEGEENRLTGGPDPEVLTPPPQVMGESLRDEGARDVN